MNKHIKPWLVSVIYIVATLAALLILFSDRTILMKSLSLFCGATILAVTQLKDIPAKLIYPVVVLALALLAGMMFL